MSNKSRLTRKAQMLGFLLDDKKLPPFCLSLWERLVDDHLMLISQHLLAAGTNPSHSQGGPTADELCLQSLGLLLHLNEQEGISRSLISGSP